jgi:hypothetical protein
MKYKYMVNWRQIFKGPNIEMCSTSKIGNMFPFYANKIAYYQTKYFPHKNLSCPVEAGPIYAYNISQVRRSDAGNSYSTQNENTNSYGIKFPNGLYQFTLHISTKSDPYLYFLQWTIQVFHRLGENNF